MTSFDALANAIENLSIEHDPASIYTDESIIILESMLTNYTGEVTGQFPKGNWGQDQHVLTGMGSARFVLDTYTNVLYNTARPYISFTLDINGTIKFKDLIDAIQDAIFIHFINPLNNGEPVLHSIEDAYIRGKLWLGYEGIELLRDEHGPYYLVKFTD